MTIFCKATGGAPCWNAVGVSGARCADCIAKLSREVAPRALQPAPSTVWVVYLVTVDYLPPDYSNSAIWTERWLFSDPSPEVARAWAEAYVKRACARVVLRQQQLDERTALPRTC